MKTIRPAALLVLTLAAPCFAQADSVTKPKPRLCWRGKPAPSCGSFWVTEFGYDVVLSRTQTRVVEDVGLGGGPNSYDVPDFESHLAWTVGPMFNTSPTTAIGGTLSVAPMNSGARVAVEGRRRWWILDGMAFDLSAGAVRLDVPHPFPTPERSEYGLTVGGYILGGDLVNVSGRADVLFTGGKTRVGTSVGVGLGSYAAAGGTVLLGALVLAFFASIGGEY